MRAVVTGGAGFIGSHLCERLIHESHDVVCVDNFVTSEPGNVEHLTDDPHFQLVRRDITQGLDVPGDVDAVFHLASPASPADYLRLPLETLRVGSAGTWRALDLAAAKGARFLLASTSESYGDPLVHPQPESYWGHVNPVGPRSVYDEAKRFGEALTMAYRRHYGVDAKIVRIFNTFGPRMRADDGRAIPTFIDQALRGEPITVTGDGSQTRSLCYVDDLVDGLLRMLASDHGGPVNLGNPHEVTMLELAQWINKLTRATSEITLIPRPQDDPERRRPDITMAREVLGWEPVTPVEHGLCDTITDFRRRLTSVNFTERRIVAVPSPLTASACS
ncbi:UDP-glucuronic acid decarboxylase family protein [Streptomyces brevispora]|uniref:SDR family oxidoreductase n=1 Tax=Streptomyces brevispora TaxID=887462 RepID=A0A561V5K6_9ACTN|nr:UDP-glucuronic acid decarboxylase family protein [Streptomyces brevispora]TWG06908.1 dTDP-glucose 4,6-dehydratase [Streptomyces brevispora]WSC12229.1 SDR family oxidoreductase [Streptomyces brevispora]